MPPVVEWSNASRPSPRRFGACFAVPRRCSSSNSAKARPTVEWFTQNFGGTWRAGHVTGRNQVYNRVPEQFKHRAANVAYIVSAPDAFDSLQEQVDRQAYAGLRNVLFIERIGNNFRLERWLHWGTAPSPTELGLFPGATPVMRPQIGVASSGMTAAPVAPTPPDPGIDVGWDDAEGVTIDPSGLAGALEPFRQAVAALKSGKNVILMGPPGGMPQEKWTQG